MRPDERGDHAELRVASELKRLGYTVLFPYTEMVPYDVVAASNATYTRMQVKSSTFNGTSVIFSCYNSSNKSRDNTTEYTSDDIEGFAVYNDTVDESYWVPVEERNERTMALNVTSENPKRPADEYVLSEQF